MQIPILSGIYTDEMADFNQSYPRNLVPVPVPQGISNGYLKSADGIVQGVVTTLGVCRGAINWNGILYAVVGTTLIRISDAWIITNIGTIAGTGYVRFDYSFDYLSISGGGNLYLYNGVSLTQVTDPDLGTVVDNIWVDGYFMTTDGEYLVVTELADPFAVDPLKYGSSEIDPDPIVALLKLNNEPHAINRYTIEVFDNIGGTGFPFSRIDGAVISKGAVGTRACCLFDGAIALVGGGRNEKVSIWICGGGKSARIATRGIDKIIGQYTDSVLSSILMETRSSNGHDLLYIHLPDKTLVFDANASQLLGQPVWFMLDSGTKIESKYKANHFIWCYDKWICSDPVSDQIGYLDDSIASHWGSDVGWEINTGIIYNESRGALIHELELVALTGRTAIGANSTISAKYSLDGETWSTPRYIDAGLTGERQKRLVWLGQGPIKNWRIQKFGGDSLSKLAFARLEVRIEPLME